MCCENWRINKIQKNYLFTKDLIYTYVGKFGGPTWFVDRIKNIVLENNDIHLLFFTGKDVKLELTNNQQEIFKELERIYMKKR